MEKKYSGIRKIACYFFRRGTHAFCLIRPGIFSLAVCRPLALDGNLSLGIFSDYRSLGPNHWGAKTAGLGFSDKKKMPG